MIENNFVASLTLLAKIVVAGSGILLAIIKRKTAEELVCEYKFIAQNI